ncbi:nuclear transport factor 2 family protein [Winogradskyella sp. SYSU M77433]|uniref:nuclear transport factor 2 family protein n=1 Tax=Winogradskyella sp. SYSU M77433 TaxID=3042722 RepID=UPI0024802EDE|nr:nuclear transport factor 2 family protein [Winogradskyella sp. SYSU M77433]MDH7912506.1 ester cyclase [Winogradskyella sp. SYSU M77433]
MKPTLLLLALLPLPFITYSQGDSLQPPNLQNRNKDIAWNFYKDLWFTNNTDKYVDYVAEEYVVHDIGDRKDVVEPAIEQKITADRFWDNGSWDSKINYQIAEGDLVATRWEATYKPSTFLGKVVFGSGTIPIINVFRFNEEGKIVEIWNHRHDIDTNQTMRFTIKGLLIGLLMALIPTIIAIRLKKKLRAARK